MNLTILALWAFVALTAAERDADLVRDIEDNLIAPCCWSQSVSQHYSEAADQIRKEVREMVAAGKGREEILDFYVAKYGERILATPRPKGFNALVYVLPWAALLIGASLLHIIIKKLSSPRRLDDLAESPMPDGRYSAIVDKEIRELKD